MMLRAIEEKGSCRSAPTARSASDFQLIAGTNRELGARGPRRPVPRGPARAAHPVDVPPARAARAREDIEPNLDYELERVERAARRRGSFKKAARDAFLRFAARPRRVERQLPRPRRRGPPHGDARARRADRRGRRWTTRSRGCAAARGEPRPAGTDRLAEVLGVERAVGARSLRSRAARRGGARVRAAAPRCRRPAATLFARSRAGQRAQRRRSPAQVPRALRGSAFEAISARSN